MICKWGNDDCKYLGEKCLLCTTENFHYKPVKIKKNYTLKKNLNKSTNRMGNASEIINHQKNVAALSETISSMTPNSGAGKIKGDEQISGLVSIMEEVKTKIKARGKNQYSIKRAELEKLEKEAFEENKEFWFLIFSFNEYDKKTYAITDKDLLYNFVSTLVHDRRKLKKNDLKLNVYEKRINYLNQKIAMLNAKVDLLSAEKEYKKSSDKDVDR